MSPRRKTIRRIEPWKRLPQHFAEEVGGNKEVQLIETPGGDFRIQTREREVELDPDTEPEINIDAENVFIIKKGVEISYIDLDIDGALSVECLALALEDGTVLGDSWLANSLRGDIERHGPPALDDLMRRFNNGYTGAALVNVDPALTEWDKFQAFKEKLVAQGIPFFEKAKVYVPTVEDVPKGYEAQRGKRGGIYYESRGKRGRPPQPRPGDLIMIHGGRYDGDVGIVEERPPGVQGTLVTVRSPYGDFSRIFGRHGDEEAKLAVMQRGYAEAMAQRRGARERRKERAQEIADSIGQQADKGNPLPLTFVRNDYWSVPYPGGADYPYPVSIYKTDTGLEVIAPVPGDDAEKAPSLESVETAISQMPPDAVNDLKAFTQRIVLSPIPHARDAEISKNFVAAGTMDMTARTLTLYPKLKDSPGIAAVLTHEVGHAVDSFRETIRSAYRDAWYKAWDKLEVQGTKMPAHPKRMREAEEKAGIPDDPNAWRSMRDDYNDIQLAMYNKDKPVWLPDPLGETVLGEKRWVDLDDETKAAMLDYRDSIAPVTEYAERNEREYYAEAYEKFRYGRLPSSHVMYKHFTELERVWPWLLTQGK